MNDQKTTIAAPAGGQSKRTEKPKGFIDMLTAHASQIAAALPEAFKPDRMLRLAMSEFRKQPKLEECVPVSVFASVVQAAQLGLDFSLGHCFLVPYKKSEQIPGKGWQSWHECQLIISFRGYIELARRSGEINSVDAHVVYEGDEFEYEYGTRPFLRHKPTLKKRGSQIAAYSVAVFKNGTTAFDVMPWSEIESIKNRSKSRNKKGEIVGPWATDEDEMARKSAVRRLSKYLPLSVELRRAVALDEAASAGVSQNLGDAVRIARQDYDRIDYGDAGRVIADEVDVDQDVSPIPEDQTEAATNVGTVDDEIPFAPDGGEDAPPAEKKPRGRQFASPDRQDPEPEADPAPAAAKEKPLYQRMRARITEATSAQALEEIEAEVKALEPGDPPAGVTKPNIAVLLASIARKRGELQ